LKSVVKVSGKNGDTGSLAAILLHEEADKHDQNQCASDEYADIFEGQRISPFLQVASRMAAL
jgi:hypothetical protein